MKFTEEQFKEIIRTYENNYGSDNKVLSIIRVVNNFNGSLSYNEAFALANPVTREWAREQFVEPEKKYVWSSKKADRDNNVLTLYIDNYGMVSTSYRKVYEKNLRNENMLITESEIREWGYNPEMFDKEEVE